MQKILKNEKGSISLFILLAALFFLVVVTGVGVSLKNKEAEIDNHFEKTKSSYEKDVGNEEQIYNEIIALEEDTGYGLYDYETGVLKKSWLKLLKEGIVIVDENGNLSTPHTHYDVNSSSDLLDGKLVIGPDVKNLNSSALSFCKKLKQIVLPEKISSIPANAFGGCSSLEKINLPKSVQSIGNTAFGGCENLISIEIPNNVQSIGSDAFGACKRLTNLIIPQNVTSIGQSAFHDCTGLTEIVIPKNVSTIGQGITYKCTGLTKITIECQVSYDSISTIIFTDLFSTELDSLKKVVLGTDSEGEGMTDIPPGFMAGITYSTGITDIELKNSITSIQHGAFASCNGLESIIIPEGVTTIRNNSFSSWKSSQIIKVSGYASASQAVGYENGWSANATVKWKGQF